MKAFLAQLASDFLSCLGRTLALAIAGLLVCCVERLLWFLYPDLPLPLRAILALASLAFAAYRLGLLPDQDTRSYVEQEDERRYLSDRYPS